MKKNRIVEEPEEVAAAFDELESAGKVRYFGVSNQNPMQMALLQKYVKQPLMANQLQFGLGHTTMIQGGFETNMLTPGAVNRDGSDEVLGLKRDLAISLKRIYPELNTTAFEI